VGRFVLSPRSLLEDEGRSPRIRGGGVNGREWFGLDLDIGDGVGEGSLEEHGEICLDLLSNKNNLGESGSGFFFTLVGI
jgi:hypothetical protein